MNSIRGRLVDGSENKVVPEVQAAQAFGLNHCINTPWTNPGAFPFFNDQSGCDVAIL